MHGICSVYVVRLPVYISCDVPRQVVCSKCSSQKMALPYMNNEVKRVCDNCFLRGRDKTPELTRNMSHIRRLIKDGSHRDNVNLHRSQAFGAFESETQLRLFVFINKLYSLHTLFIIYNPSGTLYVFILIIITDKYVFTLPDPVFFSTQYWLQDL